MTATLPVAKNSLTSDCHGSGQRRRRFRRLLLPAVHSRLGTKRGFAFRAVYGFLAPTGSFKAGANDNVGSGYWTHAFSSGQTFYLTRDKKTIAVRVSDV